MNGPPTGERDSDQDANRILSYLLEELESVLEATKADCAGQPQFAVEARLSSRLSTALPGVRFTSGEIEEWSARLSS